MYLNSRISLVFLFLFLGIIKGYSQDFVSQKSVYLELGGTAGFASLNYEKIFTSKKNIDLFWRLGITGFPIDKNGGFVFVIPATYGALIGKGKHKFELGIGQGISITTKAHFFLLTTPIIGYRFQNNKKPFFIRLAYTPLISYLVDFQYQNWIGISFGYNLKISK